MCYDPLRPALLARHRVALLFPLLESDVNAQDMRDLMPKPVWDQIAPILDNCVENARCGMNYCCIWGKVSGRVIGELRERGFEVDTCRSPVTGHTSTRASRLAPGKAFVI